MKALNQTERNNLYLKFFFLFTLTVLITVFALFFNFKVPAKLNEVQRQKLKYYNDFNRQQKEIIAMIDSLNTQIENLDNSNKDWTIEKTYVANYIGFAKMSPDTTGNKLLLKLDKTYKNYLNAKCEHLKNRDKSSDCKEKLSEQKMNYEDKLKTLEDKVKDLETYKREH